jgi:hypothetical protein
LSCRHDKPLLPCGAHAHEKKRTLAAQPLETALNLIPHIGPVAALIAGILILIMPRLLNFIVAIYLIIIGLVGLLGK